jgi:Uridine kinase
MHYSIVVFFNYSVLSLLYCFYFRSVQKSESFLVGLAGGSATGKTTFIKKLNEVFGSDEVCVITQDNYYKGLSEQLRDQNGMVNFDHPTGIDFRRIKRI